MIFFSNVERRVFRILHLGGLHEFKYSTSDYRSLFYRFQSFKKKHCIALSQVPTMIKSKNHEQNLEWLKSKISKSSQPKPPSEIYLSVLGNGAKGSPRALYMFTDQGRYLFNCGEGTQRLAHEHKMKLGKLEHVFVTHKSWENLGGLIGLSLTVHSINVPKLTLHGPPGIEDLYHQTKSFANLKGLEIGKHDISDLSFVDNCMEVRMVPIYSSSSRNTVNSDDIVEHRDKRMKSMGKEESHCDVAVAYICKGHSKPGQLVLEKCIEQGVPPGPLLGDLKNGKDVVLPNGNVVKSSDVVGPEDPCPVFLVVECPSNDFLDALVDEKTFEAHQISGSTNAAALVVHFSPPTIMQAEKYRSWMKKFPNSTCHLVLNSDNSTLDSAAIHRIQHKLHLVHPQIFTLLCEEQYQAKSNDVETGVLNIVQADTLCRFYLRPQNGPDLSCSISLDPETYVKEGKDMPGFKEDLEKLKVSIREYHETASCEEEFPEVVFLGTGSSIPSKVRNVTGILINTSSESCVVFDCGEGTYGQLLRLYGQEDVLSVLKRISLVFVSHVHADHHLGLIQLLKEREKAFTTAGILHTPVVVIAPSSLGYWFEQYHMTIEPFYFRFIPCFDLQYDGRHATEEVEGLLRETLKNVKISTVPVNHCFDAYGACLTSDDGWKLVYSGDTTPSQSLIEAGKDCTLLIHEATMEEDLEIEAAIKMHSTTSQAIEVSEKMGAKSTILSHFSQRYAKIPVFSENFQGRVGCAFDNMRVRRSDFEVIPLMIPTLKSLFAQEAEELVERGVKRLKKRKQIIDTVEEMVSS